MKCVILVKCSHWRISLPPPPLLSLLPQENPHLTNPLPFLVRLLLSLCLSLCLFFPSFSPGMPSWSTTQFTYNIPPQLPSTPLSPHFLPPPPPTLPHTRHLEYYFLRHIYTPPCYPYRHQSREKGGASNQKKTEREGHGQKREEEEEEESCKNMGKKQKNTQGKKMKSFFTHPPPLFYGDFWLYGGFSVPRSKIIKKHAHTRTPATHRPTPYDPAARAGEGLGNG